MTNNRYFRRLPLATSLRPHGRVLQVIVEYHHLEIVRLPTV